MVKFIFLVSAFVFTAFPNLSLGGTIGTAPNLTIGDNVFTNLTDLIQICGNDGSAAGGASYYTPRVGGGASGYTPSSTNNFRVVAFIGGGDSSITRFTIGYTDNDLGMDLNARSNPIYLSGNDAYVFTVPSGDMRGFRVDFLVLNGKYPFIGQYGASASGGCIYGYEEAP